MFLGLYFVSKFQEIVLWRLHVHGCTNMKTPCTDMETQEEGQSCVTGKIPVDVTGNIDEKDEKTFRLLIRKDIQVVDSKRHSGC